MSNSKKNKLVGPKNILEASATVHRFLSVFSFTRISNRNGRYVARDIKFRSAILAILFLGFDLISAAKRAGNANAAADILIEILSTCALWSQYLHLVLSLNKSKEADVFRQYDMLSSLDQALGINTANTYRADKFRINVIFFITVAVRLVTTCAGDVVWAIVFFYVRVTWPYVPKAILTILLSLGPVMYLVKIVLFKVRSSAMHKKISKLCLEILGKQASENKLETELQKMNRCYLRMLELCKEINLTDGFQVMLSYTNMLCNSIIIIKTAMILPIINKGPQAKYILVMGASTALHPIFDIVFIVAVLAVLRSIAKDADRTAALVEKYFASDQSISKTSRESWTELVELMCRNPLVFTAADFFTLDYSLIVSTIATVVTYTIILTQIT